MKIIAASLFVLMVTGSALADPPATQPSLAIKRLADLEKNVGSLEVGIRVFVNGKGDEEELHLLSPDNKGGYKEPFFARLTKDEMTNLLRHLAVEGFLVDAFDGRNKGKLPPPVPPYVQLSVGNFFERVALGPETLKRLEGIKAVLPDEAAAKMERMLAKVREKTAPATTPAAAEWTKLHAEEGWYRDLDKPEQVFVGTLQQMDRRYQLGSRFLWPDKQNPVLDKLVGQKVEIRGKPWDVQLKGMPVSEIWAGAVRSASQPAATSQPATTQPAKDKEILSVASFSRITGFILAHGDRQTYCQMYNNNPHVALGGVNLYLNPDTGPQNINCDPKLSGFNQLVIRTDRMEYYSIKLDPKRSVLDYSVRDREKLDGLRELIPAILSDLDKKDKQP